MRSVSHGLEATSFRIMISENLCSWLLHAKKMTTSEVLKKGRMEMLDALSINFNVVLISWVPSIRQTDLLWKTLIGRGLYTGRRPGMP